MARRGHFTQAPIEQKLTIDRNTHFGTLKYLTMNSSNTAGDQTNPSNDDEVNTHVVAEVVRASAIDEQSPNQPTVPPVEVFTTMVSNVS